MARRILTLDIGAYELTMAEFRRSGHALELVRYATQPISAGIGPDGAPGDAVSAGIKAMMRAYRFAPGPLVVSISGQVVFPRFVKLPPVSSDKVAQIVRYEAEQNVPFPIDEVVWDYQLIGGDKAERQVMLVAVKAEIVEDLTNAVGEAGLEPRIVEVAPLALYNAVCHNYPEADGCTVILDVGARSTNLVFVEPPRVFSRSIPVAGNTITQELMKEFELSFEDAEQLKREQGMVALGGVTGSGDPVADQVAKTVRNIMTRLHAEVNRSINFYRSQQGGGRPQRVLLTGGSSVLPEMDTFFAEKLGVDVAYLNPVRNVSVGSGISNEEIERDAQLLGEVVGLALRDGGDCASEINLMPRRLVALKAFRRRIPFMAAAAVMVIAGLAICLLHFDRMGKAKEVWNTDLESLRADYSKPRKALDTAHAAQDAVRERADLLLGLADRRTELSRLLYEVRSLMLEGMWLRELRMTQGSDGVINSLQIRGYGFRDRLSQYEGGEASSIEVFRDRLASSPLFSADETKTRVLGEGFIDDGWAKEFSLRIGIATPDEAAAPAPEGATP